MVQQAQGAATGPGRGPSDGRDEDPAADPGLATRPERDRGSAVVSGDAARPERVEELAVVSGDAARPERIVDAHVHVACTDTARFPVRPTGVGSGWWEGGGGSPERLLAELDAAGVAAAVVVQAVGVYGYDGACATSVVAAHPDRFALVAALDLSSPDPAADLASLMSPRADGSGTIGADEPSSSTGQREGTGAAGRSAPSSPPSASVRPAAVRLFGVGAGGSSALGDGRAAEVWRAAAEHGVGLVPCVFSTDLDAVAAAADAEPSVSVAVDHCGFPDREGDAGWAAALRLAEVPSISLKVTSYVLEACERDDGDTAAALDRLVGPFGADRLCWGSDHPQQQAHTYAEKLALALHAARRLDAPARDAFFGATAHRLWFTP